MSRVKIHLKTLIKLFEETNLLENYVSSTNVISLWIPNNEVNILALEETFTDLGIPVKVEKVSYKYNRMVVHLKIEDKLGGEEQ